MSAPHLPLTRRQRVEERERAILDAARDVFVANGYAGARMAEIARRAGIAEGTVYLYYRTKDALMEAIVADFWAELTEGAQASVDWQTDTFEQFRSLAEFHLQAIIESFDIISLTQRVRGATPDTETGRAQVRTYVAVFDQIFRQGIDRGVLIDEVPVWIARDVFFGTLEISGRTLLQRDVGARSEVSENLVRLFRGAYERPAAAGTVDTATSDLRALVARMEAAIGRLEQTEAAPENTVVSK
jgi:TetR/AcrR family transcriptional regulator, fatty acid metabolism regulator protein